MAVPVVQAILSGRAGDRQEATICPKLAAELDLSHPRFVGENLFAHFRKQGHVEPDLVAEVKTREGEPRLALVHVETEGRFRRSIDDRMLLAKVDTYVQLTEEEEERFAHAVEQEANEEILDMIVTWEEALAEREARGEARGEITAAQEADLRAARRRFGQLPPAFEERIRAIRDLDHLYRILDRILEARTLAGVDLR